MELLIEKKLGQIVFSERHSDRVKEFSAVTWEHMKKILDCEIFDNVIVDWILLPHTKYWKNNAIKILIKPENDKLRYDSLLKRDNVSMEYLQLRDKASIEYNENEFDYIIYNTYDEKKLTYNVEMVSNKILGV